MIIVGTVSLVKPKLILSNSPRCDDRGQHHSSRSGLPLPQHSTRAVSTSAVSILFCSSRMPTILGLRVYAKSYCCRVAQWDANTSMVQATRDLSPALHEPRSATAKSLHGTTKEKGEKRNPLLHAARLPACCAAIFYRTLLRMCMKDLMIRAVVSRMSGEHHSRRPLGT